MYFAHSEATAAPTSGIRSGHQWKMWLAGLVGARYDRLRHFRVVEPGVLFRAGQPHVRDLDWIRANHGLRCIVAARGGIRHPLRGRWFRKEKAWCAAHDVNFVHIPMADFREPEADVFGRFVELVSNPANQPLLVHCEQGFHRTGILCAAYRLADQGWSWEQAVAEMQACGFDPDDPKRQDMLRRLRDWHDQRV
jgi:protein tyrosine/serine phosphatase